MGGCGGSSSFFQAVKSYILLPLPTSDDPAEIKAKGIPLSVRKHMTSEDFILKEDRTVFYNSFRLRAAISGEIALIRNSRVGINGLNFKRRLSDVSEREREGRKENKC